METGLGFEDLYEQVLELVSDSELLLEPELELSVLELLLLLLALFFLALLRCLREDLEFLGCEIEGAFLLLEVCWREQSRFFWWSIIVCIMAWLL